jgi:hypothetical protein
MEFRKSYRIDIGRLTICILEFGGNWESERVLGSDPWKCGFESNFSELKILDSYILDQGLINKPSDLRSVFTYSTLELYKI